eukprot:2021948-Amphidinium_carterae.1
MVAPAVKSAFVVTVRVDCRKCCRASLRLLLLGWGLVMFNVSSKTVISEAQSQRQVQRRLQLRAHMIADASTPAGFASAPKNRLPNVACAESP